ncbi:unnamed protein product [Amoebophrya sp. A120]|nr:unnamed protein product [Amoebophrya sp. A120]|eukprot:GSA120T00014703001.1
MRGFALLLARACSVTFCTTVRGTDNGNAFNLLREASRRDLLSTFV